MRTRATIDHDMTDDPKKETAMRTFMVRLAVVILLPAALGAQEVTLPLARYDALRERARIQPTPTPGPVREATLDTARLELEDRGESLRVTHRLTLTIAADGWTEVALPAVGTLVEASLGALEGRVAADGSWKLLVRGRGRHEVRLVSLVPVARDDEAARPTRTASLPVAEAGVADVSVRAGATVAAVEAVSGGVLRGRDGDGRWLFAATPGASLGLRLLGAAPAPAASDRPLRYSVTVSHLLTLRRTRLDLVAWLRAEVLQGQLSRLEATVPPGLEVISVDGDGVAGWDLVEGRLRVEPLGAAERLLTCEVRLTGSPQPELTTPLLEVPGAARTLALVAVAPEGDALLELVDRGAARAPEPAEKADLPEPLRRVRAPLWTVPDALRPPRWLVTWPDAAEVLAVQVDRVLLDVLAGEDGRAAFTVWLVVRSSGATSLEVSLPAATDLGAATRDGVPVTVGLEGGRLAVPLSGGTAPQVVRLDGLMPLRIPDGAGRLEVPLPALSAPVGRVEARIVVPGDRSWTVARASQRGAAGTPPGPRGSERAISETRLSRPPGFEEVQAAWSALAPDPEPVVLDVTAPSVKREWF